MTEKFTRGIVRVAPSINSQRFAYYCVPLGMNVTRFPSLILERVTRSVSATNAEPRSGEARCSGSPGMPDPTSHRYRSLRNRMYTRSERAPICGPRLPVGYFSARAAWSQPDRGRVMERRGLLSRMFVSLAEAADRRFGWPQLPKPFGILTLIGLRTRLRERPYRRRWPRLVTSCSRCSMRFHNALLNCSEMDVF